ncbi:MAG TPA: hypothetical protein VNA69_13355 [Thermoanaerobaculia bacterium]|nr:hypothetical protein [Thermoanaerobaculia bacterium]
MTTAELGNSLLVHGPGRTRCPQWDARWRLRLVNNLERLVKQLWQIGITNIFIDGSFVEDKDHPKDIDGYFETTTYRFATGALERELNAIEPIWTWNNKARRPHRESEKAELPMWHKYRVDLWPQYTGSRSGLRDRFGNDLPIAAAFRISRRLNRPRGLIKLEAS